MSNKQTNKWARPDSNRGSSLHPPARQAATIPIEIMQNRELAISCLRGLIDADGGIFKDGNSISIRFSSHDKPLIDQVGEIGRSLGIFTFRNALETGTRSWNNVVKYFRVVGSSNIRHIVRFQKRFSENKLLKKSEVVRYYKTYKGISLPFSLDGPVVQLVNFQERPMDASLTRKKSPVQIRSGPPKHLL